VAHCDLVVIIDNETESIHDDGMEKFVTDLGVAADDVVTLILAWHFNAETLGEFSKEEFENGMKKLRYVRSRYNMLNR
jgi:hypothetical protein